MIEFWNDRYNDQEYVYGKKPNLFFAEWIQKFEPGSILMPADGEGRNGVFAARLGWQVSSFDLSATGKAKALVLAKEQQVNIDYEVGDMEELQFKNEAFDAIGLIYAHFAADKKTLFHKKLNDYLKPGGVIILEAYNKNQLQLYKADPEAGGRRDYEMLYSAAEILADFEKYKMLILEEKEIILDEGKYHIGKGHVVRFVGRKPF